MSSTAFGLARPWLLIATGTCFLALASGCGSSDSGSESDSLDAQVKAPYGPPTLTTKTTYRRTRADGTTLDITSEVLGDIALQGIDYVRHRLGDFGAAQPSGTEMWLTGPQQDQVVVAGGESWSRTFPPAQAGDSTAKVELDQPVTLNLAPPMGEAQSVAASGTVTFLGQSMPVEGAGTYTMTASDETVDTEVGPLQGCRKYEASGSLTSSDLATILGVSDASATAWYHPSFGFVKASIQVPGKDDYNFDFLSTTDMGSATSGVNQIQGMTVLHTLESFDLNTYNVRQDFDADKDQHARMLVEARFADDARAKTSDVPPVVVEFGTVMGVFPSELVASPVSFFHPEENGKGYTFWIGYVSQAAKNEPTNGISYHVKATVPDYGTSAVRVTSRIVYHMYTP